jgi:tetrapyrrole methylase family protein / MazG family protein
VYNEACHHAKGDETLHPITIVGLGLTAGDLTDRIKTYLSGPARVLLRTARCGAALWMDGCGMKYTGLDELYDQAADFDVLQDMIVLEVERLAAEGELVYGVLDLRDRSVMWLAEKYPEKIRLVPGVPVDGALTAYAAGPADFVAACDATSLQPSSDQAVLIREIDSRELASEVKLRLMERYPEEARVLVLSGGTIKEILLCELDRLPIYDHRTSALVPAASELTGLTRFGYDQLNAIMRRLRAPDGCPWDRKQTHESLRTNVVEEAYEVVDAIDRGDMAALYDELGDLLLQVALHAEIAREHGEFNSDDVTSAICLKLISRHPHVFGEATASTPDEVLVLWEQVKKKEKQLNTQAEAMRAVTRGLPALMRAEKVQKKAANVGFDWPNAQEALPKVLEEAGEVLEALKTGHGVEEELGDLLFAAVNVARLAKVQPELALGGATEKFVRRFEATERLILADGKRMEDMTLPEMDAYWDRVKRTM